MALEDMDETSSAEAPLISCPLAAVPTESPLTKGDMHSAHEKLESVGLSWLDMNSCDVSEQCKSKMADLIVRYKDIFSHHHLDCGEAKGFIIATLHSPFRSKAIPTTVQTCAPQPVSEAAPSTE